jgi:hypothetical protein
MQIIRYNSDTCGKQWNHVPFPPSRMPVIEFSIKLFATLLSVCGILVDCLIAYTQLYYPRVDKIYPIGFMRMV